MKKITYLFLLLIVLFFYGCTKTEKIPTPDGKAKIGSVYILPSGNGGFEVYSAGKELLLEFSKENTESLSLETLNYIYETVKEDVTPTEEKDEVITSINF